MALAPKQDQISTDLEKIPREILELANFFPLPGTSSISRRMTRAYMNGKIETRTSGTFGKKAEQKRKFLNLSQVMGIRKAEKKLAQKPKSVLKSKPNKVKRSASVSSKTSLDSRATTPEMFRSVINESFGQFLAAELGRLAPSRQMKARAKIEAVLTSYTGH